MQRYTRLLSTWFSQLVRQIKYKWPEGVDRSRGGLLADTEKDRKVFIFTRAELFTVQVMYFLRNTNNRYFYEFQSDKNKTKMEHLLYDTGLYNFHSQHFSLSIKSSFYEFQCLWYWKFSFCYKIMSTLPSIFPQNSKRMCVCC